MVRDETTERSEWDVDAFEEWLTRVAESRDISEGAVLDRMMSSYWVLDEFEELLEERDLEGGVDAGRSPDSSTPADDSATPPGDADGEGDAAHVDLARFLEVLESFGPGAQSTDAGEEPGTADGRAQDAARIDALQRELTLLTAKVDRLADRQSNQSESLAAAREALSESEDRASSDEALESVEELESAVASLRDRLATVEDSQRTVRETLNDDLSHVEKVLRYLVDETDEFDDRLEELDRALQEELDAVREEHTGRRTLERLVRTANELGVTVAACDSCDDDVELGLLVEPRCPHCSAPFVDVRPKQGWFGSPTVETTTRRAPPAPSRTPGDRPRSPRAAPPDGTTREPASDAVGSGAAEGASTTPGSSRGGSASDRPSPDRTASDGDDSSEPAGGFDWQTDVE